MGLPDGWVSDPDVGLTPTEQLTALGNGVVPAQAIHALSTLRVIGAPGATDHAEHASRSRIDVARDGRARF